MGNSDMTITFGQTEVPEHSVCVWTDHLDKRSSEKLSRPFELLKSSAREAGAGGWHINDLMSGQLSRQLTFLSNEIASRWKSTHYPGTSNTKTNLYRPIILPKARAEIFIVCLMIWEYESVSYILQEFFNYFSLSGYAPYFFKYLINLI